MTRALLALYLACLTFAGSDSAHAPTFAALAPLPGFLALTLTAHRITRKGRHA